MTNASRMIVGLHYFGMTDGLHFDPIAERALENLLEAADEIVEIDRGRISVRALVPREGNICNHRHEEPLFVLSMVA